MVTLTDLLDLDDTDADAFPEGLQGNIVKGHDFFTIASFVKMPGGEYLYAPSMAFLRGLETTDGGRP
jgi:hypothetical protein